MPSNGHPTSRTQTPIEVASLSSGHSTPSDRRRRRGDSESVTPHPAAPSAKRPRTSASPAPLAPHSLPLSHSPSSPTVLRYNGSMLRVQNGPVSGRPAAKKLVIKNRRVDGPGQKAQVETYFDATWEQVSVAVQAMLAEQPVPMPLDRVCRGVEDLCRNGKGEDVYDKLRKFCERHLAEVVLPAIKKEFGQDDTRILVAVLAAWKTFNEKSRLIRSTFSFLDRAYLYYQTDCLQINDQMIKQFRDMLSRSANRLPDGRQISAAAVDGICSLVQLERNKDSRFQSTLLHDSIAMLHVFGVYQKWFEGRFIELSTRYLGEFASDRLGMNLESYIRECLRVLDEESARCDGYNFDSSTKRMLLQATRQTLLSDHADKLLDMTSFSRLITSNEVASLSGLYQLLEFADMIEKLKEPWVEYIRSAGLTIVHDTARSGEMVTRLLELKQSLDTIIREAFGSDEKFEWSLREAFSAFMNDRKKNSTYETGPAKIGEMIAKYIDMLLRGGLKALPRALLTGGKERQEDDADVGAADEEGELDRQLDRAVALFRFVDGKDAFEAFYKRDLARRLLMDRSASQDAERTMLAKLKGECGANFTHNLEQMFKDKALAKDEMEAYRQSCTAGGYKAPFDLQVTVLSSAAWPSYPDVRLTLPPVVSEPVERFDKYYKDKHSGRILTWKHGLAHCVLTARFPKGMKELHVSALQAVVLLLFNDGEGDRPLSYAQISQATNLSDGDLSRTLQSLACGKTRVITKHPKGRDVAPTDTFTFNARFSDDRIKIKINQIQMKETKEENKATHEKVERDRRLETQAAIVRIMKSRKELGHALLVAEVIEMTRKRGPVDAAEIKKEIGSLIEKDFLEREGDSYTYLA
ncbi:related to cullin homolog 4A [Cephalotrichum gorgonifer]|uniref:Related to cullin homolog 4A n=1 Tax=Cephalotrichum gorgonifer TaxID=2041049 RepID=A0AAE8N068_9PEZI|nr:related to cullin homolog 4A [Cephalotrichum gorgonifer]